MYLQFLFGLHLSVEISFSLARNHKNMDYMKLCVKYSMTGIIVMEKIYIIILSFLHVDRSAVLVPR